MTAAYLACLALGYLIGSLSVSILISKYIFHQDVRTLGSGNAGAANAARTLGAGVGLLTLLGDFLKGVISMLLGSGTASPSTSASRAEKPSPRRLRLR